MFVGWLGISPEDYRCRFRACRMTEREWPFAWARQLEDAVARWLRPGPSPEEAWLLNLVVLKQFVPAGGDGSLVPLPPPGQSDGGVHAGGGPSGGQPGTRTRGAVMEKPCSDIPTASCNGTEGGWWPWWDGVCSRDPAAADIALEPRGAAQNAGSVGDRGTCAESVRSWRWGKCSVLPVPQHPPPVREGHTTYQEGVKGVYATLWWTWAARRSWSIKVWFARGHC